ncbi:MAG: hypothetical protein LLG06_13790 [Desulfobacteraceae bacterium]|nr:hypothetical protein [Desulfobacteraceae bacterium]
MATFPTLSRKPSRTGWSEEPANDSTIRGKAEAGYVKTRPRYTRVPMKWKATYQNLTTADYVALLEFQETVKIGGDAFYWTHPITLTVKTVRLAAGIKFGTTANNPRLYSAEIEIEEI